jgi:hypothetical protein
MIKLFQQSQTETDLAIEKFLKGLEISSEKTYKELFKLILKDVTTKKGRLVVDDDLINQVRQYVIDATNKSTYQANVLNFIDSAKDVGRTDIQINKELGNKVSQKVADRLLNNNGIFTDGLTKGGYEVTVVNRVQFLLYEAMYNNYSVVDLQGNLEKYFMGQSTNDTGDLVKWARQTAQDAIYQYTGELNAGISEELGLNALFYTPNILIEGSRPICKHLIKDFEGAIPYTEIMKSLKKAEKDPKGFGAGMIEGTITIQEFLKNRGGYNCIHKAYPTFV